MEMTHKYDALSPTQGGFDFGISEADAYGEPELYMDPNAAASQPSSSPKYHMPYFQEYNASDVYPSPEHGPESPPSNDAKAQQQYDRSNFGSVSSISSSGSSGSTTETTSATLSAPATNTSATTEGAPATASKPPAKRKRENRYKNAPPSVLSRRRAQNRASQRAYRERKDQRIKDLEQMLGEARQRNESLTQTCSALHSELFKLRVQYECVPPTGGAGPQISPVPGATATAITPAAAITSASLPVTTASTAAPTATASLVTGFDPTTAASMALVGGHHHDRLDMDPLFLFPQMGTAYAM